MNPLSDPEAPYTLRRNGTVFAVVSMNRNEALTLAVLCAEVFATYPITIERFPGTAAHELYVVDELGVEVKP